MPPSVPSLRRRFLKRFALGALAFPLGGKLVQNLFLTELDAATPSTYGLLKISLTEFPSLLDPLGSLRLGMNPVGQDHFPQGTYYPILINRDLAKQFHVLSAECRHAGCVVDSYDDFVQGLECPCHRSLYGIDGSVLRGPTTKPLKSFVSHYDGHDLLTVRIPGLTFSVTPRLVPMAGTQRLKLDFTAEADVVYELQFKQRLSDDWSSAPFAVSPEGALDQLNWSGPEGVTSFYVDRVTTRGYYAIIADWVEV